MPKTLSSDPTAATADTAEVTLTALDQALLKILVQDGRASFADIARQLGISRAYARARVLELQASGVIEMFGAVINPDKLGKSVSTFLDIQVKPCALETIAQELADCPEVASIYIMNDLRSLHVHTLTDDNRCFERFVHQHIFNREEIVFVDCKTLLTRVKHRRGGIRL